MFTGIVTHQGRVKAALTTEGEGRRFVLQPETEMAGVALGASIAINGVCLTVSHMDGDGLAFDVVPETLRKTTLGGVREGDLVNMERSLHLGDEMGGHQVQGHVEGVADVTAVETQGEDVRVTFRVGPDLAGALIPKGSVAIDGVSLTIGEVWRDESDPDGEFFCVYLVPHTLAVTGFGTMKVGDRANLEPDVLGRWVEHHVRRLLATTDSEK